ncbi:hypothetical protein N7447_011174 [Penicillium robsamsonii]|uniref:uncharacterized protein n=1 Tax=Penicillium robsamsonii TaxID=1792511 RepID=UPI0025474835|nr:uncharacterized protein N7447_011174 [Penicillium robsamsonii]KAJ5807718.1 hypothetical protein N7447_011174 [Penicillium robsamsonii]
MADQLAIYDATLACHQVFRDLGAVPILEEWAENCLADLNLWANGAGALKVGKASLDARLSSNLDAKIFVVNLLRMLQGFVEKCVEIGSEVHNDTPETFELSQAIQDVNDIMGQLSRITISIRKAGTNARIQKADASYDPDHPQVKALSQHLQLLLLVKPSKNGTLQAKASPQGILVLSSRDDTIVIDPHSLTAIQQRLIKANLKRRNRFLYAQRHAMKLSERHQVPSTSIPAPRKLPLPPVLNVLKGTTEEHGVPKVYSATTATEVQDPIALPTQASAQPATTVISTISSRVTYPRPPPLRSDQNVFQCPCCYQILPTSMSRGSQWKSLPWAPGEDGSDDDLYDGYYEEHPYFNIGRSVGTESERSRSTMSSEQRDLKQLPAVGSGGETTENSRLTEEKIRGILENPNVEKDMLDAFLNGIENQESFQEPSPLASVSNLGSVLDSQSKYEEAEAMHRRDLEGLEKVLGPGHPDNGKVRAFQKVAAGKMAHPSIKIDTNVQTAKRGLEADGDGFDVPGEQGDPRLDAGNTDDVPPFLCQSVSEIHDKFEDLEWMQRTRLTEAMSSNDPAHRFALESDPKVKARNRYFNVQAWANCRIHLRVPEGECDFINASPIILKDSASKEERTYIATQGPKLGHLSHFWHMVFHESKDVAVIVMLTQTFEAGREKCAQYFPLDSEQASMILTEEESDPFVNDESSQEEAPRDIGKVTLLESTFDAKSRSEIRKLELTIGSESKIVWHFLFAGWADYSKPEGSDREALLELIKLTASKSGGPDNPRVVHCSAGVGRTGTFIALDHLLQELESGQLLQVADSETDPVFETVNQMREQRMMMVYNEIQMQFIYEVLREQTDIKLGKMPGQNNVSPGSRMDEPQSAKLAS